MNTVKIRTVDDHGLGFVCYDHDMSSIGTAATVIGAGQDPGDSTKKVPEGSPTSATMSTTRALKSFDSDEPPDLVPRRTLKELLHQRLNDASRTTPINARQQVSATIAPASSLGLVADS